MATRSDFAQKLLSDLKMRKERMATSKNSSHSSPVVGDGRGKPGPIYKGSRQTKALQSIGSKPVNSQRRSSGGTRPPSIEESSKQMVPFGRTRNHSEQIGDLSMALTFAIQNGGKLTGTSSILSFLNQIGRRSFDYQKMRKSGFDKPRGSTSQLPTLSHLHIKEISKGAQNLNQILRACSNGLNLDGYSIDIGKQLLKGAMDLEESLRMLVNMQEASEYMVTPQRKNRNRIRLLEEDEDDDDDDSAIKIAEQKQLDRPRFSFDKPSRKSRGDTLMSLTYPTEAPNFTSNQAMTTFNLVPHKRSTSSFPDFKSLSVFLEPKNHSSSSQPKAEQGKISNVIAKLMGLEEIPVNGDSNTMRNESSSKQHKGAVTKKSTQASTKNADSKTRDTENPAEKNMTQANKIPVTRDTTYVLKAEKVQVTRNGNLEGLISDGKSQRKDLEKAERMEKQQRNISQLNQNTESRKDFQQQERRHDNIKHNVQNGVERGETKAPQRHKSLDAANVLQQKICNKESTLQTEERYANRLFLPSNQPNPQDNHGSHQPHKLRKPEPQEEKHQREKREQLRKKQKFPLRKQKGSEVEPKSLPKVMHDPASLQKKQTHINHMVYNKRNSSESVDARPLKGHPNSGNQDNLARDGDSSFLKVDMKDSVKQSSDQNKSPRERGSEREKHVHGPATQKKTASMKMHKSETPRKKDEVMTRRNGTVHNFPRSLKHHIAILQETKQRRQDKISGSEGAEQLSGNRSKEPQPHIIKSIDSKTSIQPLNGALQMHQETEHATLHVSRGDEFESPNVPNTLNQNDGCQNIISELPAISIGREGLTSGSYEGQELNSLKPVASQLTGNNEESPVISSHPQNEYKTVYTLGAQELLTENETLLKQILMKSQVFIHSAEALFRLNIPIGILNFEDNNNTSQEQDNKLIVDCGYEVMKRKGRNQELAVHPFVKISIGSVKVRSLNDLVKQLDKDFEKLKFYSGNGSDECDAADYLLNMLEKDIRHRDPDLNSMWDFGWNEMVFAFLEKSEIAMDVEKHVLNGLLDEVMEDLLHVSFPT